jgi:DNA-binding XRE family transcriptional regulator
MDYSNLIKELRNKMLLTQTEFADLLGVSFGSVNRWENGKYEPTIKAKRKLKVLCLEYNIKFEDFELKEGAKNGK